MRGERVKVGERKIKARALRGKSGLHGEGRQILRGEGGQARRASLGDVDGSMSECVDAKALQDYLQSLGFTASLAKPEIGKEVGDEEPAHEMTE